MAAQAGDNGLWQPQVRAIIGADNNGGNTAIEGFLPLKQNLESVLFLDVRSKYDFDDGFGQDVGLGVRRIVNPDLMIGGYAYLNIQNHDSHQFVASTLGLEAITSKYDAHVNVYLPISGDRSSIGQESSLSLVGHQLIEQISAISHRDYAAWGIEGEVGVQVPLNLPENHSLRFDVGAYHFGDPDGDDRSVTGGKAGLEYTIGDVIGTGTSLTFTGEVRNDNRDNTQFAGSVRLTVPFNAFEKETTASVDDDAGPVYPVSPGLRKRVNERVRGDIGVRIESQDKDAGSTTRVAINAATNTAFGQFFFADGDNDPLGLGTIGDPTTLDNAVSGAGANGVVVALGGKGNITTPGVTLAAGQTVIGGAGGVQAKLADGSIGTFNFGGSNGTIQGTNPANNVLTLANGNTLSGITITGGKDGIFGNNVTGATLTNVTVTGTGGHGADFTGNSNVKGSNFTASGNGIDGLHIEGDGTYNFTGTTLLQANLDDGLDITGHGTYTFATLNALDNNDAGITVKGTGVAGSITITGGQVSGNKALGDDGVGVFIDPITAHIVLDSITQTGGTSGVVLDHVSGSFTVNGVTNISNTTGPAIAITDSPAAIRFGDINITNPGTDGMVFAGANTSVIAGNIVIAGLGAGVGLDFSNSATNFTAQSLNITGTGGLTSIGIDLVQTNGGTIIITNGGTIANVGTGVRMGIAGSPADTANAQFTFGGGSIGGNLASLDARGLNSGSGLYAFGTTTFNGPQLFDQTHLIFVAAGGSGAGTSLSDLASITDADNNHDSTAIFVLVNRGVIDDTDGFTLDAGQTLASFGNGRTFSLGGLPVNVTGDNVNHGSTVSDGAGAATLTASGSGDVVTLANNTSLQDFNISGGTANGIHGSNVTGVVLTGMNVSGAALNGVLFDGAINDVSGDNLNSSGNTGHGLLIDNGAGTYNFTGTTTLSNNTGSGLFIVSGGNYGFETLDAKNNGGVGILVISTGGGSLTTTGGAVSGNGLEAVSLSTFGLINPMMLNVTLDTVSQSGGQNGIGLSHVAGNFSVTGTTTVSNTLFDGISIFDTSATVDFGGAVTITQPTRNGIAVSNNSGAVTFGQVSVSEAGQNGIDISGNTGALNFSGTTFVTMGANANTAGINFAGNNGNVTFGTTSIANIVGSQTGIDFSGSSTAATFGLTDITANGDLTSRGIDLSSTTGNKTITFLRGSSIANAGVGVELSSGGTTATSANANFTFGDGTSADGLQSFIIAAEDGYTVNTIGLDPGLGNYDFDDVNFTGDAHLATSVGGVVMISESGGVVHAGTNGLSADVTTVTAAQADAMLGTQTFAFVGTVDLTTTPFTLDSGQSITGFGNGNSILTSGTIQPVNVQGNLGATGGNVTGDEGVVMSTGGDTLHLLGSNQVRHTAFDFTGGSGSVFTVDQSAGGFNNAGGIFIEGVTVSNAGVGQTAFKVAGLNTNLSITNNNINVAGTLLDANGGTGNITVTRGTLPNGGPAGTLTGGGISIANRTGGLVNFTDKGTIGGNGVSLTNNTGSTVTFADVDISSSGSTAFNATGGGAVNVTTGTINATGAQAVNLDGITANINFASTSATFSAGNGVNLQGLTGTVALGTGTLTNTGSGTAFNVGSATNASGGNATISYAGTIASNGTGAAVSIQELTGGSVTLSGNLTDGNATDGGQIFVGGIDNGTAATVTFSGASKKISSGATTAVQMGFTGSIAIPVLDANDDATINFSNGGLDITTTTGAGFVAGFGGTLSISGTGNKIASGSDGLGIAFVDVGSAGVNFDSISAVSTSDGAGVILTGSTLAGDVNIGGLRDTGYMGASLNALLGTGSVNFTGTTDLDVSFRGFDIGGPQVGTINIANVAGSTLTIDGGEAGIVTNGLQAGTINVGGNGGVASIGATTSTTGAAIALSGGNDLIHATLNYNGSIKVSTGMVFQAVSDWSELNMSGSVVSTTAASGPGEAAFVFTGNANGVYNISSTINHTGAGIGVRFDGSSNGTATFSGASKIFNTSSGTNDAIFKAPSIGPTQGTGTLNFTNGGLVITTSSGTGFKASTFGAGSVSVSGAGNTITTGTGTAVNLDDATIGAGGFNFASISSTGAATGIALDNVSGGTLNLGTVNLQGITGTGVQVSGTLGATVNFASLTIAMPGDNSTGISFANAVVNSAVTTGGFTLTSASSTGTTAVNLSNTTGTGTIQLGDPNTAGASSSIGGPGNGPGIGFQFTSTTAINLIYGDGEGTVDKLSTVKAVDILNSTGGVFPVGGTYNFQDVDGAGGGFIGDLSEAQGPTTYYVDQDGDGDGTAANPGSIEGAEASGAAVIILVDTSQNGTSNLIDMMQAQQVGAGNNTLNLAANQILIGLKAGDSIDTAPLGAVGGGLGGNFSFSGINATTIITAGSNVDSVLATLTTANGNTIDFSGKTGIENVIVQNTGAGLGISGTNITDLILRRATIRGGTGGALSLTDGAAASQIALSNLILSATGGDIASVDGMVGAGLMKVSAFSDITLLGNKGEGGGFALDGVTFDANPATPGIDQVDGGAFIAGDATNRVAGYGLAIGARGPLGGGDLKFDTTDVWVKTGTNSTFGGLAATANGLYAGTVGTTGSSIDFGTASINVDGTGATGANNALWAQIGTGGNRVGFSGVVTVNTVNATGLKSDTNGTLFFGAAGNTVATTGGPALAFTGGTLVDNGAGGSALFATITSSGGANGIVLSNVSGGFSVTGATTITGTTGFGIDAGTGNTGTFNFNSVTVNNAATTGGGIGLVTGTLNVTGLANIDTTTGAGLSQTGGTTSFTGGLTVDTTSGDGLLIINGSAITVTGANNTVTTATGRVVSMQTATIGLNGVTFETLTATGMVSGAGVQISGVSGGVFNGGDVSIAGSSNNAITVQNATSSTVNFASATVSSANINGIDINGGVTGTVTFGTVAIDNTGASGVRLLNTSGTVNINGGSIGATNDPAGIDVEVSGGAATLNVAASLTKTTTGKIVDISGVTGGTVTLTGNLSATGGFDNGIYVHGNTGGTFNFTGTAKTLTTGANNAVDLATNTGAAINFSGGGLAITTTSGTGFSATGGGTVNVAGTTNTIATTTGTALNLNGVVIGTGVSFNTVSTNGAATGIALTNVFSPVNSILLGTVNLQGITSRGVDVTGTLGVDLAFNDLDIGLNSTSAVAFDLNGATINAAITANDFDVTNAAATGTSIAVDLRGAIGGQTVRLGDAAVGGASSSIAGVNTGVFLNSTTNLAFTYGDGESATDQLSTISANVGIDASSAPVAGTYNFQDVNFQATPGLGFGIGKVYFVGASATGDGSGRDQSNLATLTTAEAAAVSTDIIVLVNDGGVITAAGSNGNDTLALAIGQQVRGFGNGNINLALTVPSTIQLASNSISIIDQTPNGAATLTTTAGSNAITLGASGNIIDGFILDGSPAGAARGIKDNGAGASGTTISHMTIRNFATAGIEITPSTNTTISDVTFTSNATDVIVNAAGTTITNVTSTGATGIAFDLRNTTGTTTLTNLNITTAATGTGIVFGGASGPGGTINGTNVDISGGSGISVIGGNAAISFDGTSSINSANNSNTAVSITNRTGGSFTYAGTVSANGGASGIVISGATAANTVSFTGTVDLGTGTTMTGTAVSINNNATASTVSFADLDIVTNGTTGFSASNGGTVNVTTGTVSSTGAQAVALNGIAAGINFTSTTSTGGVNNVSLTNVTGTVALGTGALSGATGTSFDVSGGSATVTYAGTITQATAGQRMIAIANTTGGAINFTTATVNGLNNSAATGTGILIDGAAGNVTVNNASLTGARGITILGDAANNATGTFTFNNVAIQTTAGATNHAFVIDGDQGLPPNNDVSATVILNNVDITNPGGNVVNIQGMSGGSVTFDAASTITRTDSGLGILASSNLSGTVTFGGSTKTLTTGANNAVDLSNNGGTVFNFTNGGLAINTTNGTGFNAINGGTVSVTGAGNTITTTSGVAVNLDTVVVAAVGVNFATTTKGAGGSSAVIMDTVTGTGTVALGGGSLVGGSAAAIRIGDGAGTANSGGTAGLTYTGTITSGTGQAINIQDRAASAQNITLSGNITHNVAGVNGIQLDDNAAGTITFSGASKSISSGTAIAVNLTDNAGATINFTGGGLVISTTSGNGFSATGAGPAATTGGTVTVQGTGNTINSSTGTALSIVNTTIGASDVTFQSITSTGSSGNAGIVVDNTGSSGGLKVTGTGAAGTGGTISNKTGADILNGSTASGNTTSGTGGTGIFLRSTANVSLASMQLNDFSNFAVYGKTVTGFTMTGTTINGVNGNNNAGDREESAIRFDNLLGTASITGSSISGGGFGNLAVWNTSGTLNRLTMSGNTFGLISSTIGNDNVNFTVYNSAVGNVTLDTNTFSGTRSDFFEAIANNNATMDVVARNNTFHNGQAIISGGGVAISVRSGSGGFASAATTTFDISHNTLTDGGANAFDTVGIFVAKGQDNGTMVGTIASNAIGPSKVNSNSDGIFVRATGAGTMTTLIQNNTITGAGNMGIHLQNGDGSATLNASVYGNTVSSPTSATPFSAFYLDNGTTGTDTSTTNLVLGTGTGGAGSKNTFNHSALYAADITLNNNFAATTLNLSKNGSASATVLAVVQDDNNGGITAVNTSGGVGTPTLVNTLPVLPPPVAP